MAAYLKDKHPDARFIEEIALKTRNGGYSDSPGVVLYQENPPEPFTNKFFAYYKPVDVAAIIAGTPRNESWTVVGLSTFDPIVEGALVTNNKGGGVLAISRFRNDFFYYTGSAFIDGGRDYTRLGGSPLPPVVRINLLTKKFEMNGAWHDYTS
jgi:hypothetical protein